MNYLKFDFEVENPAQGEMLIALLGERGFEGFEEDDSSLNGFILEESFDEAVFSEVIGLFAKIGFTKTVIEHINWNKKWETGFEPVLVGDFVAVRAGFHEPVTNVAQEIIITPKMSFGTGHHATTCLMISLMKELDFTGKYVLDFGTGTGILAILASKLGAAEALAIDYDEWSIINTNENIQLNNSTNIKVKLADAIPANEKFDILLANITFNTIIYNLPSIVSSCHLLGRILFSGFLKENESAIIKAIEEAGLKYLSTLQRGDWIAVMATKL